MDMSIWFLLGAVLVFFMGAGFAMVETGFTRAKNAGNIIMKNFMDFCIGTIFFVILGYGIMNSENYLFGLIGMPTYQMFTDFNNFNWSNFFFQLVFCGTCATIVSGAMAERTKFSTYCMYSAIISAVVYPIEAGWVWNGQGWLAQMGFIDFAGSAVIHMVGGITAFVGAALLGARIGKYGKDGSPRAIPGHAITLGALGCFILWFCWYGFNGAAASDAVQLAQILSTTTLAPAAATLTVMLFTWGKYGKPDVSMTLNGSLAGLVAITAGCAVADGLGAIIIGVVSGFLVCFGVWFLDYKARVDDPVGAVAVHGFNGVWGALAVGLFDRTNGLFYGGGFTQLGIQILGVAAIAAYTFVVMFLVFKILKVTIGLRVPAEVEIQGLDMHEHGLQSAYADFMPAVSTLSFNTPVEMPTAKVTGTTPVEKAVPVERKARTAVASDGVKLTKIEMYCNPSHFDALKSALEQIGITGMTVTNIMGCGAQRGSTGSYRGVKMHMTLLPKIRVDVVISKIPPQTVIEAAKQALYTGHVGDGKIFVYDVENAIKVRTGATGYDALQDDVDLKS